MSQISHPGFMPPGTDLAAILRATSPPEVYVLLAFIACAEPTGQAGRLETDRTAAEIAEAAGVSRHTIDRALNGHPGQRGLIAAGLIADAGTRGRRTLRTITLPMHGQPTTLAGKNTTPLYITFNSAADMRHDSPAVSPNSAAEVRRDGPKSAATMRREQNPERRNNAARSETAPQKCGAEAPQKCGANPPAFNRSALNTPEKTEQQQLGAPTGQTCNNRADTDAAREILARELAAPAAEKFAHIIPLAAVRAAIKRADAQAVRGFRKTRRDYIAGLLRSPDFIAEAQADATEREARAARAALTAADQAADRRRMAAAAMHDAETANAQREAETAALNSLIEDMDDAAILAILRETIAAATEADAKTWRLAARAAGGPRAAIRRPGLRAAFIARAQLIASGEPRTIPEAP